VSESYASSPRELVGQTAQVRFDVSQEAGTIQLRDRHGNLLDLQGRAPAGSGPFRSGTAVRIVSHVHSNVYLVGPAT